MAIAPEVHVKRPNDVRKYDMRFADTLVSGDAIATLVVSEVTTSDLTFDQESSSGTTAQVRIAGGTDGEDYAVLFAITTDNGETDEVIGRLQVRA